MIKLGYKLMSEEHARPIWYAMPIVPRPVSISRPFLITSFPGLRSKATRRSPGRFWERWQMQPGTSA
jgi:hypothetical protein